MKRRRIDPVWRARTNETRTGVMAALRAIRGGEIEEEEVDKLQNFCPFALALMEIEGPEKWSLAKINAEIMSLKLENKTEGD